MSPFSYSKHACLKRSKELAQSADLASLLYAALEARLCIEAIAYDKIRIYAKRLPESVLKKWQPPQVIKALLEYETGATENFTLSIAEENADGSAGPMKGLGFHVSFKPSELQKLYNKLGSFLHAPTVKEKATQSEVQTKAAELKSFLATLLTRLTEVCSSTIDGSLARVVTFDCVECGAVIMRNEESLKTNPSATCLSAQCQAEYVVDLNGETPAFVLKVSAFECQKCKEVIRIANHKLKISATFKCSNCNSSYEVAPPRWGCFLKEGSS
jgi:predicted RNA-binding Zn-ribbon protein involved in translation (DUF1610 family)